MAFIRNINNEIKNNFTYTSQTLGDDKVSIPLVITYEKNLYHGFTPGIIMKDIVSLNKDICVENLKSFVKQKIIKMINDETTLPFFPSNEEIKEDFDNVRLIKRIVFDKSKIK